MAATRSGNKPSPKKKRNTKVRQEENVVKNEVILISILATAILLFLCNFGVIGTVGNTISAVMFGLFGILAYVIPILIFIAVAFGISNQGNRLAVVKLVAGVVLFLIIGIFAEQFTDTIVSIEAVPQAERTLGKIVQMLYTADSQGKNGGGVLCGSLAYLFLHFFDKVGTVFVLLVLGVISVVLLTQKSFLGGVQKGSKIAYESAKEEAVKRREQMARRREEDARRREEKERRQEEESKVEEEKRLRMDKKVSGVMLDTTLTQKTATQNTTDDIHEIMLNTEEEEFEKIHISGSQPSLEEKFAKEIENFEPRIHTEHSIEVVNESQPVIDTRPIARPTKPAEKMQEVSSSITEDLSHATKVNPKKYKFPSLNLLAKGEKSGNVDSAKQLKETAMRLQQTLQTFGVRVTITDISQGPAVTRYELQPEQGVKVSKIVGLTDDIKLNLAATDIRIEAPIPGKAAVGIEVPNKENAAVALRDLLETKEFQDFPSKIAFAVGKDIGGKTVVTDIGKMPHMLIAGATGSGKSVCINTLIMSILYKAHPDDVKLIMIDPKVVELSVYNGIPHLLIPVVTDPKKASAALHWGVAEMTERYKKFADLNVRDLKGYNKKVEGMKHEETGEPIPKMPQIVIIVDELADLMMVAPGEVEESICRLAQLARAAGIHLIIATQRPSVDVITGLIKANMPSRVAFSVSSGVDSRTILDMNGAEKLLGKGDMLFYPQGYSKPARVQGAFVSDKEVSDVVDFLKNQAIGNVYSDDVEEKIANIGSGTLSGGGSGGSDAIDEKDMYFADAGRFIIEKEKASIGMLQRVFKIGFNRAARIMDQLADAGVVGEEEGTKPRKVLMSMEEFENYIEEYL